MGLEPVIWSQKILLNDIENSKNQSRAARQKKLIKAELKSLDGVIIDAVIRDISEKGANIKPKTQLYCDDKFLFTVRGIEPIGVTVRWFKSGLAGLEFENVFDLSQLRFNKSHEAEGIYRGNDGYHVFDRFKSQKDFRRPALKPRR